MSNTIKRQLMGWGFWLAYLMVCIGIGAYYGHHHANPWILGVCLFVVFAAYYYISGALDQWAEKKFPD